MRDLHICEHCDLLLPLGSRFCPSCRQPIVLGSRGAIALWRLGDVRDGVLGPLARGLRRAFRREVVIQPTFVDERPSLRPGWRGRSATVFLGQILRRHRPGTWANLGITEDNIVPSSSYNFLFGLAYLGRPAAIVSLHEMGADKPSGETLARRVLQIAVHELGHTRGLDHHAYGDRIDCVMVGDEAVDSRETIDSGSPGFCAACRRAMR